MAGAKTAKKNSRTSGGVQRPMTMGDVHLIISCNGGHNAYLLNAATQKNPNFKTNSAEFVDAVRAVVAGGHGAKLRAEVESLAKTNPVWAATLARLDEADAFAA